MYQRKQFDNGKVRPSIKAVEQATHELPILRTNLEKLKAAAAAIELDIESTALDITYYENVLAETTESFTDGKALQIGISAAIPSISELEVRYLELDGVGDKILFVTRQPEAFGKEFFEGGKDIADFIIDLERKLNNTVPSSLHSTIQSTVSRLYTKQSLLKFRFKGTKGKLVAIHPEWYLDKVIREAHSDILNKIEQIFDEDDGGSLALVS